MVRLNWSSRVPQAYELRDRVSDPEKFYIQFLYDRQVTGNLKRPADLESWAQTYPHFNLSPWRTGHRVPRLVKRASMRQKRPRTQSGLHIRYDSLAFHNHRPATEVEILRRAAAWDTDHPDFQALRFTSPSCTRTRPEWNANSTWLAAKGEWRT